MSILGIISTVMIIAVSVMPVNVQPHRYTIPIDVESAPQQSIWITEEPITEEEIQCMALNIYFEARGEVPDAQYAVADVVMHRLMHFDYPNTVCGVVKQGIYPPWSPTVPTKWRCAFSWFCDGKDDVPKDLRAYGVADYVARDVLLNNKYVPVIEYALFYHASYTIPSWSISKKVVAEVGNHIFYL